MSTLQWTVIFALPFLILPLTSFAADDCNCPKLSCNPQCQYQSNLTFYSQQCDNGNRVKSCSRPTCLPLADAPAQCAAINASLSGDSKSSSVASTNLGVNGQPTSGGSARAPASVAPASPPAAVAAVPQTESIGRVGFLAPPVWRIVGQGQKSELTMTTQLNEGDEVATGSGGRVTIVFNSGNRVNLTPNSEMKIRDASDCKPDLNKKRMVLDLLKGEIRNEVNRKYDGKHSYYRVFTKSAVAGVRGTIFVVSSSRDDSGRSVTMVETLRGRVQLSDLARHQTDLIAKNQAGAYIVASSGRSGFMTSVHALSADDIAKINSQTEFIRGTDEAANQNAAPSIVMAQNLTSVCHSPSADFNQCAWTCEHNPSGEKSCRVDLPNVQCVRRICDANGDWVSPTRLPASYSNECRGDHAVVGRCDY